MITVETVEIDIPKLFSIPTTFQFPITLSVKSETDMTPINFNVEIVVASKSQLIQF